MITSAELAKLTALSMDEVNQDIEELKENGQILYSPMKKRYIYMACGFKTWSSTGDCEESGTPMKKENPYRYGMKKAGSADDTF